MTFVLLLPTIIAILTLGGHFLRYGLYPVTIVLVGLLFLLMIDRRWAARTMQVVLVIAAVEWIGVLNDVVKEREMEGRSPVKSVFILGGTAAFTLLAAALYQTPRLKRRFSNEPIPIVPPPSV
jgi:hypothetical protein